MKKYIIAGSVASLVLGFASALLYKALLKEMFFSIAVTFFTAFYHFIMRVVVACMVTMFRKNKNTAPLYCIGKYEEAFYRIIKIKKWKKYMPTYDRSLFSVRSNSYGMIMRNMKDAQIGHLIMAVLSFVPIAFAKIIGGFTPFLITSVLSAAFDIMLVLVQRYNMARVSRILKKTMQKNVHKK